MNDVVTLIFSKDRPLQLDLTLNTYKRFSIDKEYGEPIVLYTTSNNEFEKAYDNLKEEHPEVKFLRETIFKENVINTLSDSKYLMFVVDDCIFTDSFSLKDIIRELESNKKYLGFSLRLGKNTTYCYPLDIQNTIPYFSTLENSMISFDWSKHGQGDFYYPLEVSSSIYRVGDIKSIIKLFYFSNPNFLEHGLASSISLMLDKPFLLCYEKSRAFCNPVNLVQTVSSTAKRATRFSYSPKELLEKYKAGLRINSKNFEGFTPKGCHDECELYFIHKDNYGN